MFSKELVEAVVQDLEKYAQASEISTLESLAKIAVYQDSVQRKSAGKAAGKTTDSQRENLNERLAASVALGK
jgi:hypothetical protein